MRSPDEVMLAGKDLSDVEIMRLVRYAEWRMHSLGENAASRTAWDLLSDAMIATLTGDRTWNENVTLYDHLHGAIRSISTRWRQKKQPKIQYESQFGESSEEGGNSPLDPGTSLNPERILAAKEELRNIKWLFAEDVVALRVLALMGMGCTGSEIKSEFQMSHQEYAAAVKRIRRRIARHYRCHELRLEKSPHFTERARRPAEEVMNV